VNNLDEDVTISAEATYNADTDFSDAYELGSHTVPAGDIERASLSNSWDKIRIIVQAKTSPSSGVFIGKKH
jgi:hypothetical protein